MVSKNRSHSGKSKAQVSIETMLILFICACVAIGTAAYLVKYGQDADSGNFAKKLTEKYQNIAVEEVEIDHNGNYAILVKNNGDDVLIKTVSVITEVQTLEAEDTTPDGIASNGVFLKKGERYVFKNLNVEAPGFDGKVKAEITINYVDFKDGEKQGEHLSTYRKFEEKVKDNISLKIVAGEGIGSPDTDEDGVIDEQDTDDDDDGILDHQDVDDDGDDIADSEDEDYDSDSDGIPDVNDTDDDQDSVEDDIDYDDDGDGVPDSEDPDQDTDGDLVPDITDTDDDGDDILDVEDEDTDGDNIPDLCDPDYDYDSDGIPNALDIDDDNDGLYDIEDPLHHAYNTTHPCHDAVETEADDGDGDGIEKDLDPDEDSDGDGIPNAIDEDVDGDGTDNCADSDFDSDYDGTPDSLDTDDDNDGVLDIDDIDDDGDGINDVVDPTHDTDCDGTDDYTDTDDDGDGIIDAVDTDDDGDGTPDAQDPDADPDGDGVPNGEDSDSDGDGTPDWEDPDTDSDGDGIPDSEDTDDDNDGTPDTEDEDADGDGIPDGVDDDRVEPAVVEEDGDEEDEIDVDVGTVDEDDEDEDIDDQNDDDMILSFNNGRLGRWLVAFEKRNNPSNRANWRSHWTPARIRWQRSTKTYTYDPVTETRTIYISGVARRWLNRADVGLLITKQKGSSCITATVEVTPRYRKVDPSQLMLIFRGYHVNGNNWIIVDGETKYEFKGTASISTGLSSDAVYVDNPTTVSHGLTKVRLNDLSDSYVTVAFVNDYDRRRTVRKRFAVFARTKNEVKDEETATFTFNLCKLDNEETEVTPTPVPTATPVPPAQTGDLDGAVKLCVKDAQITENTIFVRENVDVIHVMDVSGSMAWGWNGQSDRSNPKRMQSAKSALLSFDSQLQNGDRLGLVTFGKQTRYNPRRYGAVVKSELTEDISAVDTQINGLSANGGTPLASGIKLGRETLLANRDPDKVAVMIVVSDGEANVKLDGRVDYGNTPANQALAEAATTRNAGIIVYSIAVGNDPAVQTTMAQLTDSQKYFHAATDAEFQQIYSDISSVIGMNETNCAVSDSKVDANGLVLTVTGASHNEDVTVASGSYTYIGIPVGDYTFSTNGITHDGILYDRVSTTDCGDAEVVSATATNGGTSTTDLYLRSADEENCDVASATPTPTPVPTATPAPTATPTPVPATTCNTYCQGQGFSRGQCRLFRNSCAWHRETYKSAGNTYCNGFARKCCCRGAATPTPPPPTPTPAPPTPTPVITPVPTPTPTPTPAPPTINTCDDYCQANNYDEGTCRKNANKCNRNDEDYKRAGNTYCRQQYNNNRHKDTCCCDD